jgi:hypothetical protein
MIDPIETTSVGRFLPGAMADQILGQQQKISGAVADLAIDADDEYYEPWDVGVSPPLIEMIYGLYHPVTHALRYSGFSEQRLEVRLRQHMRKASATGTPVQRWCYRLKQQGLEPKIDILYLIQASKRSSAYGKYLERIVIRDLRSVGYKLLNER